MKCLLLSLLLIAAALSLSAASPKEPNTLELLNTPVYGGDATFHVVLTKKYQLVNSVVWCSQVGTGYIYMNEEWLPNYKNTLDMTFSRGPLQTRGDTYGPWDSTLPAYCSAVVFKDIRHGEDPTALTNWVSFTVPAIEAGGW